MSRAQPQYGRSARDLPEIRDWLIRELADTGSLWWAMTALDRSLRDVGRPSPTSVEVERQGLAEAHLYWCPSDVCSIIQDASTDLPKDLVLDEDTLPYPYGLVVFEAPLTGIPGLSLSTGAVDPTVRLTSLRMLRWGPLNVIRPSDQEKVPAFGLSWWAHTNDLESDHVLEVRPGGRPGWLPLGRTDWILGEQWDHVFTEHLDAETQDLEQFRASAVEDRARAMALWALMNAQHPTVSRPLRQEVRQAARRGSSGTLDVKVVRWNPRQHVAENPDHKTDRKVTVRYECGPFWARRAVGPGRTKRRWTYIPKHWRGPEDAPIKEQAAATVAVVPSRPTTGICATCGRLVELHREGWAHDHTTSGQLDDYLCPGSGVRPFSPVKCGVITTRGTPCKSQAMPGSMTCKRHQSH